MSDHRKGNILRQFTGPLTQSLAQTPAAGPLGRLPLPLAPAATATSVCGFCSTGCGLRVHLNDAGEATGLTPAPDYPVNRGAACPKGWEALAVLDSPDRATAPLFRGPSGKLTPTDWHTALTTFTDRFKSIQRKSGPDSLAWIGTGQITTEELALLGAVAKFGMGIRHGDGNTRQCMATAVTAYKQSFGFDAPPYTYEDLELSDVLFFIGANPAIAHPILWQRVLANPHDPEIIVIDPRRTETAQAATLHLPLAPKSDLTLLYGLAHILIKNNWIDRPFIDAHTTGFDAFAAHVASYTPDHVSAKTRARPDLLQRVGRIIGEGKRVSFWWTMGVNQSYEGTRTAQAIINLALMTGNIGRPGTGANSITGQCNAMGSRLFSNTTNLLGGHDFTNPAHRAKVATTLNIPEDRIPAQNSLAYDQIIDGIATGRIKGLWVIGTNPAHSWIGQNDFNRMLSKLEFLVVQDMYHTTETAQLAHLLLPAAGWGEKTGTLINSERRIALTKQVRRPPGQAMPDFDILRLLAHYWGCADLFAKWDSPESVFQLLKQLTKDQPCDITGIRDYKMLDDANGIQWPHPAHYSTDQLFNYSTPSVHRRLFEGARFFHPDAKARFLFDVPRPMPESPNDEYPFLLLTGRGTAAQWHTQTRTRNSAVLRTLHPRQPYAEVNPEDARRLGVAAGDWVAVESRRGRLRARASLTPSIQPGQVFLPMHDPSTNRLTDPFFDPHSRQPSYKSCAVRLAKIAPHEVG